MVDMPQNPTKSSQKGVSLGRGRKFTEYADYILLAKKWFPGYDTKLNVMVFGLVSFRFVLRHINHCRSFDSKSIFIHINSSVSNDSV